MTISKPPTPTIPRSWASFAVDSEWTRDERDAARRVRALAELAAHSPRKP